MARKTPKPRVWEQLAPSTRKRYLSKGRSLGQTEAQVKAHYLAGGNMSAYRGHRKHAGASERQWSNMVRAAKQARLDEDGDLEAILESLLSKGLTPQWIILKLREKEDSRDSYRSTLARELRKKGVDTGWQPGRRRYHARLQYADIEIYYYH